MADMETDQTPEEETVTLKADVMNLGDMFNSEEVERSSWEDVKFCDYTFRVRGVVKFGNSEMSVCLEIISPDYMWPVTLQWGFNVENLPGIAPIRIRPIRSPESDVVVLMPSGDTRISTEPVTIARDASEMQNFTTGNQNVKISWFIKMKKAGFARLEKELKKARVKNADNQYHLAHLMQYLCRSGHYIVDEEGQLYIDQA